MSGLFYCQILNSMFHYKDLREKIELHFKIFEKNLELW